MKKIFNMSWWFGILFLFKKRQAKYATNTAFTITFALVIISLINSISFRHKKRFDLTESKVHSISNQTKSALKNLKKDINIIAFFQNESMKKETFKDLLRAYKSETKKITYEFIDPDKKPSITKQYGITNYGTSVLKAGGNETKVHDITEESLTNAIIRVTKEKKKKIYFLNGHGEHSIENEENDGYSITKKSLEGEGFEVAKLLLIQEGRVPDDSTVLIVAGPKKPLLDKEKKELENYLTRGGSIFFMVDPNFAPGMDKFLSKWGIKIGQNIIIDTVSKMFGGDYTVPIVTNYADHDITKNFEIATFFPLVRSVEPIKKEDNIKLETIITTSENSWGEVETKSRKVKFDKEVDKSGPLSIGVALTKELTDEQQTKEIEKNNITSAAPKSSLFQMVVFGDSDFANNNYFNFSGNGDLFLNVINWLAREENFLTIRPKKSQFQPINLTKEQGSFIFLFSLLLIPSIVVFLGIGKWYQRRKL